MSGANSNPRAEDVFLRLDGSLTGTDATFRARTYVAPGMRARNFDKEARAGADPPAVTDLLESVGDRLSRTLPVGNAAFEPVP